MRVHLQRPRRTRAAAAFGAAAILVTACGGVDEAPEAEESGDDAGADGSASAGEDGQAAGGECDDWLDGTTGDFVVPYDPGGSTDPVGREYVAALEEMYGQQWNVENVSGGGASIGTAQAIAGPTDGSSLGLSSNTALAFQPLINDDVPYSEPDDYSMIVKLVDLPAVLAVAPDAPWETLEEFIEDARENPGEFTVSTSGNLTQPDQNVLVLNDEADIELRNVPFSGGGGEALTALLGGQVDANMGYGPSVQGQAEAGEIKVLGVIGNQEYQLFPDATPMGELGYEVNTPAWYGIVGPPGIPDDTLTCIRELSLEAISTPEFEEWALDRGYNYDPLGHEEAEAEMAEYASEYEQIVEQYGDQIED